MTEREIRSGTMNNSGFTYEDFEGLLGHYELSLRLIDRSHIPEDREDLRLIRTLLNGIAERNHVRTLRDIIEFPRQTQDPDLSPGIFSSCQTMMEITQRSFTNDFGLGRSVEHPDYLAVNQIGQILLGIMHRHRIIEANFDRRADGTPVAVNILRIVDSNRYRNQPVPEALSR